MRPQDTRILERALGDHVRRHLPFGLAEFVMFGLKQAWACLFGTLLLAALLLTASVWNPSWALQRYDALLIFALVVQAAFLRFRLETWDEAKVILLFHLTGTAMEWFKVCAGSWSYPDQGLLRLFDVPLFSGFMYAAVGSYMARVIRIFDMRFTPYPPFALTLVLALAIYANFFSHHYLPDARWMLVAATLVLFWRTRVWFTTAHHQYWMPLPLAAFLSSLFLWSAENIGTHSRTWLYAGQKTQELVSLSKLGSWYLLLYVSFVSVSLIYRRQPAFTETRANTAPLPRG